MNKFMFFVPMTMATLFLACSSSPSDEPETPPLSKQIPINLNIGCNLYEQRDISTRIMDTYFEPNDAIGLYVASGSGFASTGNYINNVRCLYTSSAIWQPDTELYWKDETTASDFYAYYPYSSEITDATALDFQIKVDQSAVENYKQSDFVWGRTMSVQPTEKAVSIQTRHLMSNLVIEILPGNGFTQEKLDAANVKVKVDGLQTAAQINLSDGALTANGETATLYPYYTNRQYKLLIVPQTTSAPATITVTVDGSNFKLQKSLSTQSGHRYTLPITVNKTSNGINVNIDDWIDDGIDNGGVAE